MSKDYQEAMNPERGWKYADDESMFAVAAQVIANRNCLNPEQVYNWGKENDIDLDSLWKLHHQIDIIEINNVILPDILNNTDHQTSDFIEEHI